MPDGVQVEVRGIREVNRALRQVDGHVRDLAILHKSIAAEVAPVASANAPRGPSGGLARSYKSSGTKARAAIVSRLVYAPVIEFGWPRRNIEGALPASQAVDSMAGTIERREREGIEAIIADAGLGEGIGGRVRVGG